MKYFHRTLTDDIEKWLSRREILAIKGPRQSGKTTLLKIIKDYLIQNKKVDPKYIIYITFEDRDNLDAFLISPKDYVKSFISGGENQRFYFLIDEFQYATEGGQKLKLLYDLYENIKFIITGSSSLELTGSTAKYLVGRVFSFYLYQFSFEEFLQTKEKNIFNYYKEKSKLLREFIEKGKEFPEPKEIFQKDFIKYFEEYVLFGGYPEVIKASDLETKRIILKNIYDTYITKDIIGLLRLADTSSLRTLIVLLANQVGNLLNYHSLAQDAKSYFRQIRHYLSILQETYVIRLLMPYFTNKVNELKKNPKAYFVDTGLRNYIINNYNQLQIRSDTGLLVENAVLSQLHQRDSEAIRYWRTIGKSEVDFILVKEGQIVPVEVKYSSLKAPEISRGFRSFIEIYKPSRAIVLNKGFWGKLKFKNTLIIFVPVWYV